MFTKEDATDDSKIKEEVRGDLTRVAKQSNPQIYKHFRNVCENIGRDPADVLADMLVRSLNNQEYGESILETEVTMESVSRGEYRNEDIEMVQEIAETFDLTPNGESSSENVVDKIIESRLEAVSTSPLDDFSRESRGRGGGEKDQQIRELQQQVQQLQSELEKQAAKQEPEVTDRSSVETTEAESKQDIDELFDSGPDEPEPQEEGEQQDDTVEVEVEQEGMEAGPELEGAEGSESEDEERGDDDIGPELK